MILANVQDNDYARYYLGTKNTKVFKKYYNHAKMMLIDDKILLLSSINLSDTSMDKNREI